MSEDFDKAYLRELAYKWKNGKLNDAEQQFLADWENSHLDELLLLPDHSGGPEAVRQRMLNHLLAGMEAEGVKTRKAKLWPRVAVAAAAVTAITLSIWIYTSRHPDAGQDPALAQYANDIKPGGNSATMIVDGKSTPLSETKTGVVFAANSVKYTDGSLVQGASGSHFSGSLKGDQKNTGPVGTPSLGVTAMVTLVTQRGGMYATILPDGTKAWLNAASNLEFPSTFDNAAQRIVKMKGEVYFEVAKNKKQPFIVVTRGQRTEVLGTHFNVSDYEGEGIRTTLIEGSLKVSALHSLSASGGEMPKGQRGGDVILKPNQQSLITDNTGITVKQVNAEDAIAWKTGIFKYNATPLQEVMKQVERWYNVEVIYENQEVRSRILGGSALRTSNLSVILKTLESTGAVKFRIEGRKVYVGK